MELETITVSFLKIKQKQKKVAMKSALQKPSIIALCNRRFTVTIH